MSELLRLTGLGARAGGHALLDRVDVTLRPGTATAVLGASGSGKTTLGLAALGECGPRISLHGSVCLDGAELLGAGERERRRLRAGVAAHLPQHPAAVLDPVRRCGSVLHEVARSCGREHTAVEAALRTAGLGTELLRRFPGQLSGGQRQRMALATALAAAPRLLVLDEPTTGLDTVTRAALLDRLAALRSAGTALLLLTHDLRAVRALADHGVVLEAGRVVESAPAARLLDAPEHPATRALVHRPPVPARREGTGVAAVCAERLRVRPGLLDEVSLELPAGTTTALVGESGAGKTTLARVLAGLSSARGSARLGERELPLSAGKRSKVQRRAIQYVHQDSAVSFDPRRGVLDQVAATGVWLHGEDRDRARRDAGRLLAELGVDTATAKRGPAELSGGQLARCALARALLARPRLLICDEVTAALDGANTAKLLRVLAAHAAEHGTTLLLAGHDLATLLPFCDRVLVLERGRLVEQATVERFREAPASVQGRRLLDALPANPLPPDPGAGTLPG